MSRRRTFVLLATVSAAILAVRLGIRLPANIPILASDKALVSHREFLIACVGWVLFSLYWEVAAKDSAAVKSSEAGQSRGIHVVLVNVAALLVVLPVRGLGRFVPISSTIMDVGLTVEALGLFVAIWARRHLGRNWSGEITIKHDHQLIRSGPYRLLRHPIYTGLLSMYTGTTLVTGEWLAMIGLAMAALAYLRKIRLEEANMALAFGDEYGAYRRETWALVPGIF